MLFSYLLSGFVIGITWFGGDISLPEKIGFTVFALGQAIIAYNLFDKNLFYKKYNKHGVSLDIFDYIILYLGWMAIPAIIALIVRFVLNLFL